MSADKRILKFTASKPGVYSPGRNPNHLCEANVGDTRVKHAGELHELRVMLCEHHRMVLESMFGLRLRSLKRK